MKFIPYGKHHLDDKDIQAVIDVLQSDFLTQGPNVEAFEKAMCDFTGAKYAVAVSSGTSALHIAAIAAEVQPGNALLTSPITFVASANAGLFAGGRIVFSDIDNKTVNLCPVRLEQTLLENPDVRAIVPVHYSGLPCDMEKISHLADANDALVIEDAAHALGGAYLDGSKVGCCKYSDMTAFSFHPVKAIAAGEGGVVTTNDPGLYKKLLRLRSHGINKLDDNFVFTDQALTDGVLNPWYYEMLELGFNFRMTDIQSSLGKSQLTKLPMFLEKRSKLVATYDSEFKDLSNCVPAQYGLKNGSGHHLYVLRILFDAIGVSRANFMNILKQAGIGSQVHYIPVPAHPYYRNLGFNPANYPVAQKFYEEALSIPLYYDLSEKEQFKVISKIKELVS